MSPRPPPLPRPLCRRRAYYVLWRWLPKHALTRLAGWLAGVRWPRWALEPVIRAYTAVYRVDLSDSEVPSEGWGTFNAFFTRPLRPGTRPLAPDPRRVVSPVDGRVVSAGRIEQGRLLQAKGHAYPLAALLAGDEAWERYEGGACLTLYLSPRDYHRIHSPVAGRVTRFRYVPGELWSVSPAGVAAVPGLFTRNERLVTFLATDFGEVALVKVGATIVGKIQVVYHRIESHRRGAAPQAGALAEPFPLARGAELGRFALGSAVICLFRPGEVALDPFLADHEVRMGQGIGTVIGEHRA